MHRLNCDDRQVKDKLSKLDFYDVDPVKLKCSCDDIGHAKALYELSNIDTCR